MIALPCLLFFEKEIRSNVDHQVSPIGIVPCLVHGASFNVLGTIVCLHVRVPELQCGEFVQ